MDTIKYPITIAQLLKMEDAGSVLTEIPVSRLGDLSNVMSAIDPLQVELFEAIRASALARARLDSLLDSYRP